MFVMVVFKHMCKLPKNTYVRWSVHCRLVFSTTTSAFGHVVAVSSSKSLHTTKYCAKYSFAGSNFVQLPESISNCLYKNNGTVCIYVHTTFSNCLYKNNGTVCIYVHTVLLLICYSTRFLTQFFGII